MAKIAFIGAGSFGFTRSLVRDILTFPARADSTICLMDVDAERLAFIKSAVERIVEAGNYPAKVIATKDRAEALNGADGVVCTILQGGVGHDVEIPKKYGVDINVGDTRGPAGIFRALRTIPVMLDICRDIKRYCPNAIFLNYTNPMAMICRATGRTVVVRVSRTILMAAMLLYGGVAWGESSVQIRQPEMIPAGKTLSLADAVKIALKNQPTVRQAAAQVQNQTGAVTQAKAALLPGSSLNTTSTLASSRQNTGTTETLSGTQLLYDFNRSRSLLAQAQQQLSASVSGVGSVTSDVALNVKQTYYSLLRTSCLVKVFDSNVKAQDEHVAQAQARKDAGLAPLSDVLKAAAAAASASVDLVTARNNADQARVNLNTAMGVDLRSATQIEEAAEPDCPIPGLNEAMDMAINCRPEMRQAQAQMSAAEAALKSAKTGTLPSITASLVGSQSFGGGISLFGPSNSSVPSGFFNSSGSSYLMLINVQWQPFDVGLTRGAITQARAQVVSAEETLYTVRQTVSQQVVAARLNLLAAQESLVAANAEVASAKENVDAANGRYQAGVGIFLEVLDAQSLYLKAQVDEAVARYGLSTARAQLQRAIGATVGEGTL